MHQIGAELTWLGLGLTAEGEAGVLHGVSLNGLAAEPGPGGKARNRRALVARWVARCCTIQPVPPTAGGDEGIRREAPKIQAARRSNASRPPLPFPRLPERPITGTSVAQASAGGSSSGFPFFILLPFAFAALDLTRRVALPRAIWPSGRNDVPFDPPG
jgi:hypothetical protein